MLSRKNANLPFSVRDEIRADPLQVIQHRFFGLVAISPQNGVDDPGVRVQHLRAVRSPRRADLAAAMKQPRQGTIQLRQYLDSRRFDNGCLQEQIMLGGGFPIGALGSIILRTSSKSRTLKSLVLTSNLVGHSLRRPSRGFT